jgi:hypothetical protein
MGEFKTYFTHPKIEILALGSGQVPILWINGFRIFTIVNQNGESSKSTKHKTTDHQHFLNWASGL